MRRGLISRSRAELPDAVLDARVARLRSAMAEASLDALVVYTNNTRTAGVSWLTGFVPYWSEALLVVSREREPVLVAALTYRVKSWIERTSRLADVVHSPRVGLEAARMIASAEAKARLGIVDPDCLPTGIADDLREGGPGLRLSDATELFARLRAKADPAEIALAVQAAGIARQALAQPVERGARLGDNIAAVEALARRLGAEEVYIAAAPDLARDTHLRRIDSEAPLGESFALRATVAYKGTWVRMVRTFLAGTDRSTGEDAAARLAAAVAALPDEHGFAGFASWLVEGCRIAQPLAPLMGDRVREPRPLVPGMLVSVQAGIEIGGRPVLIGAPALLGERNEAASLLAASPFS